MSANVYARIAERYRVPSSDDEAIERFFFDVAPTLSREEREAIVAELCREEIAPAAVTEPPVDVPSFSIDDAPPIPNTSTLAQLVGKLSELVERRVYDRLELARDLEILSRRTRFEQALVVAQMAETVRRTVRRMTEAKVDRVAVLDQERFVGMLSEHDVLVRVVAEGLDPDTTSVASVMTRVN